MTSSSLETRKERSKKYKEMMTAAARSRSRTSRSSEVTPEAQEEEGAVSSRTLPRTD